MIEAMDPAKRKRMMIAMAGLGGAYMITGVFGVTNLFLPDWSGPWFGMSDIMTSLVQVLVGAIMLTGFVHFRKGLEEEGDSFLLVGTLMGLFIFGVSLIALISHSLDFFVLHSQDLAAWAPLQDLSSSILLGLPSALVLRAKWREIKGPTGGAIRSDPNDH
jgi:hypothetical protein